MRIFNEVKALENELDRVSKAIKPVTMRGNNKHFEQAIKNSDEITFRVKKYSLDGIYNE